VVEARATVRLETCAGKQLQIDFGERREEIGGGTSEAFFFTATLGYSRRLLVRPSGMREAGELAHRHGERLPAFWWHLREVLLDNARALLLYHDLASREVVQQSRLNAFAKHLGVRIPACAPYRARFKGKDERRSKGTRSPAGALPAGCE
jgi:transposase